VKTSSSIAAVRVTAPARSNDRERGTSRCSAGTSWVAAISVTRAIGTGRKKTHRQPISVSSPPKTSPSENPVAPVAV
jgi:hypothetical protein